LGIEALSRVFELSRETGSYFLILATIANYCDQHGQWRLDIDLLMARADLNKRRIQGILAELISRGALAAIPDDRGRISTYRVTIASAKFCAPVEKTRGRKQQPTQSAAGAQDFAQGSAKNCAPESPLPPAFPLHPLSPPNPPPPPSLSTSTEGGPRSGVASAARPLSGPQQAVATVGALLQGANVPLPSPGQIGLWVSKLGLSPLLELLSALISQGLAGRARPDQYIHAAVMDRAGVRKAQRPAGRPLSRGAAAGSDDRRRAQAAAIAAEAQGDA
jgi:hypothetical protein